MANYPKRDIDLSTLVLTTEEEKILKAISKNDPYRYEELQQPIIQNLVHYTLIKYNRTHKPGGMPMCDRTVSLTTSYYRFKKTIFLETKLPIIISIIALLKSFDKEIISIMQLIMQLMK